jgi:hypothetical protein
MKKKMPKVKAPIKAVDPEALFESLCVGAFPSGLKTREILMGEIQCRNLAAHFGVKRSIRARIAIARKNDLYVARFGYVIKLYTR